MGCVHWSRVSKNSKFSSHSCQQWSSVMRILGLLWGFEINISNLERIQNVIMGLGNRHAEQRLKVFWLFILRYVDLCKHAKSSLASKNKWSLFKKTWAYFLKVSTSLTGNCFEYTYFFYALKFPGKLNTTCILMKCRKY